MDPTKILIWNVRGLNSSARHDSVRTIVEAARVDVVCLQETKMAAVSRRVFLSMLGIDFSDFLELPANGASGGILIVWRCSLATTGENRVDNRSASV